MSTSRKTKAPHGPSAAHPIGAGNGSIAFTGAATAAATSTGAGAPVGGSTAPTRASYSVLLASPPDLSTLPQVSPAFQLLMDAALPPNANPPRDEEIVMAAAAIQDLKTWNNYDTVLGAGAPSQAQLIAMFEVAVQWSYVRRANGKYGTFAAEQEVEHWAALRTSVGLLAPVYDAAVVANPSLPAAHRGVDAFLGVKSASAQRGASARKANAEAVASGGQPFHGVVGKRRQRKAEKEALAEKGEGGTGK